MDMEIPGDTPKTRTFLVREGREYEIRELIRKYKPSTIRLYKARPDRINTKLRTFYVAGELHVYFAYETIRYFKPEGHNRDFSSAETPRTCKVDLDAVFKAGESKRLFKVQANREYNT
jgi:hypothetical protein